MRIGFFVSEYPPRIVSGLGTYAENICQAMKNLGHDISVFTMNDGTLKTRECVDGIDVNRPLLVNGSMILPQLLTMKNLLRLSTGTKFFNDVLIYNILSASKFVNEFIKKDGYSFDIISAHNWTSAIAGIIIKRETELPFVFHLHSLGEGRSGPKDPTIIRHIEEIAAYAADRVVTVCFPLHEYLTRHGFNAAKTHVCWNTVDLDKFDPDKVDDTAIGALRKGYEIKPEEKMLLSMGDLALIKDIATLLEAMQVVIMKHPEAKLVILGKGEFEHKVSHLIHELEIEDNVKMRFEFVTEEERIVHYGASDMVICPSLYGPCNILSLEALAMQKPVIVGSKAVCYSCDHVIPSGSDKIGVLADSSSSADFAWRICNVLEDMEEAREMGKRGRKRVKGYRTWEDIAAYTTEIYNDVIQEVRSNKK
jgi:glycogen(starch) synthase